MCIRDRSSPELSRAIQSSPELSKALRNSLELSGGSLELAGLLEALGRLSGNLWSSRRKLSETLKSSMELPRWRTTERESNTTSV
eukprot:9692385-Alexandrium_andersonii.AAC.1